MAYKDPSDPRLLEKRRAHYYANKQPYLDRAKAQRTAMSVWARQLKSGPCTDCGGTFHHFQMDWDHIGDDKEFDVGKAVRIGYGKKRILAEIAKCELVCANCHRLRTWRRLHPEDE
ncbi:hypothetical protein MYRNA_144 [Mycobacterium phage Myrna]|uniref:HNH endonuclease n=1 Tax=Mycobacterium phage Myrna TaxID=546805 RepID=B5LJE6_9CAUD|nr:HNH endonuclease [Mycobacterium phage Myrna]ACH62143.1 hypothetical protein MYRNA_144 [Mycobacterium phage Myrna]